MHSVLFEKHRKKQPQMWTSGAVIKSAQTRSHCMFEGLVLVPAVLILIHTLACVHFVEVVDDDTSTWIDFWAPVFGLEQPCLLWAFEN